MGFGKRTGFAPSRAQAEAKNTAAPDKTNQTDYDDSARIFSKELWDDPKIGNRLNSLGLSPDMAGNITPPPAPASASSKAAMMEAIMDDTNASISKKVGCPFQPWLKLPRILWQQNHASFLTDTLSLSPREPWNTMFLPTEAKDAALLNIPQYPETMPPQLPYLASEIIHQNRTIFEEHHLVKISISELHSEQGQKVYCEALKQLKKTIVAKTNELARDLFGEPAYYRYQEFLVELRTNPPTV